MADDITITFTAGEIVSMHNDLLHAATNAIGPRQTGAARIVTEAQRLVGDVEVPANERCEETESGGVQCDLVKDHTSGHWIRMSDHTRYFDPADDTHPEEYIR